MGVFWNIGKIFVFLYYISGTECLPWEYACQYQETTVTCSNLNITPPWNNFLILNSTATYMVITFNNCFIGSIGREFYNFFPSAVELRFTKSQLAFDSPVNNFQHSSSKSNIKKLFFRDTILGRSDFGHGFSSLAHLESLHMYNCFLYRNLFELSFYNRNKFRELRIVNCGLEYLSGMDNLIFLEILDLTRNPLRTIDPLSISGLSPSLSYLSTESTQIGRLRDLPMSLEFLNLRNSSWINIKGDDFQSLFNLKHLDISENELKIKEEEFGIFGDMMSLEFLNISRTKLKLLDSELFKNVNKLKRLVMSHNELESIPENAFRHLISLQELNLSFNKLQQFNPDILLGLHHLRVLYLKGNPIQYLRKCDFQKFPNLIIYFDNWHKDTSFWDIFKGIF